MGAISTPALLGLVVVAPDFAHVVLGMKWSAATRIIQILTLLGIVQSVQVLNTDLLHSVDQTSRLLRCREGRWAGTDNVECGIHTFPVDEVEELHP